MLALVTCTGAVDLDADLSLLVRELPEARVEIWDDPAVDWAVFDVVIIRSTWDYHERRDDFIRWARHVESVSDLWNPFELIEWNTDKRYLLDLGRDGDSDRADGVHRPRSADLTTSTSPVIS